MNVAENTTQIFDNGGSRSGADRRQTIIKDYAPEQDPLKNAEVELTEEGAKISEVKKP